MNRDKQVVLQPKPRLRSTVRALALAIVMPSLVHAAPAGEFRAVSVDAEAPTQVLETIHSAGFTHVFVQLPYFRGLNDAVALDWLRRWSSACADAGLAFVPQWPVCGPKELILADPSFPAHTTRSIAGGARRFKPSLQHDEYWDRALFQKLAALLEDETVQFETVALDFTCTIDGDSYNEGDGYEEEYVETFRPFVDLQLAPRELMDRLRAPQLARDFRSHAMERTAEVFKRRMAGLGPASTQLGVVITDYRHNRLYEGIARGFSRPDSPTRCFVHGTERQFGRLPQLDRLADASEFDGVLWFAPRVNFAPLLAGEAALLSQEALHDFGGYLCLDFDSAWHAPADLTASRLPKAAPAAIAVALNPPGDAPAYSTAVAEPIRQLRTSLDEESVSIRGPLNRHPLFPGENTLIVEMVTIDPALKLFELEASIVLPDLSVEKLPAAQFQFSEGGDAKAALPVVVKRSGRYQVVLTVRDPSNRKILARRVMSIRGLPGWEAQLDKSYYTHEAKARIRIRRYDRGAVSDLNVQAAILEGEYQREAIFSHSADPSIGYLLLDLEGLPPGAHRFTVKGDTLTEDPATIELVLEKRDVSEHEVKFLHHRGDVLEINGRPRFVLGAFGMSAENIQSFGEVGANMGVAPYLESDEFVVLADAAQSAGVHLGAQPLGASFILNADPAQIDDRLTNFDRSGLAFYFNAEDAEQNNLSPYALGLLYEAIRTRDPYRPQAARLYAHHVNYENFAPPFVSVIDILLMSYYPLPRGPMTRFDYGMERALTAANGKVPVWAVPQAFDWRVWDRESFDDRSYSPSERELRYVCYSTVVHGGRGVLFWSLDVPRRAPQMVDNLQQVLAKFATLHPVLVEEDALVRFTMEPFNGAVDARGKWHDGKLYLFATNGDWFPAPVQFTFQDLRPTSITEWHSGEKIEIISSGSNSGAGAAFQDQIEGAGVRLYVIEPEPGSPS